MQVGGGPGGGDERLGQELGYGRWVMLSRGAGAGCGLHRESRVPVTRAGNEDGEALQLREGPARPISITNQDVLVFFPISMSVCY